MPNNTPTTYDPSSTVVRIDNTPFLNINSIEATPIENEQWATNRSSTGHRGWTKTPEPGVEITIEFSGNTPAGKRDTLRQLARSEQMYKVTVEDKSGTQDGVTGHNARMVNQPDFSRDDSEATMECVFQAPSCNWG